MGVRDENGTELAKAAGISLAATRLVSSLTLALEHLNVVEVVLTEARSAALAQGGSTGPSAALIGHAKVRNCEMAFHLLYTHLNAYFRALLHEMARKRPLEIVNKAHGALPYHEIVKLGSYEAVCTRMVDAVFRSLDHPKMRVLIEKTLKHTGVHPDKALFDELAKFLDMRNLIVHNSSTIDVEFAQVHGPSYKVEGRLNVQLGLARKALIVGRQFCIDVDEQLVARGFVHPAGRAANTNDRNSA